MNRIALILPAVLCLTALAGAAVINVPLDQPTIQEAINAASVGDVVLIADGIYTGPNNRDLDLLGKAITVRSANGPENCVIDCQGSDFDPHRGFDIHLGEGLDTIIEGLTIINGYTADGEDGGGINCESASPTIAGNLITQNYSAHDGGGVAGDQSSARIEHNTISGNTAWRDGGGIYGDSSELVINRNTISENEALNEEGGGIKGRGAGYSLRVTNNLIYGNVAHGNSGGGIALAYTTAEIIGNVIEANETSNRGGAIYAVGGALRMNDNRLVGNIADVSGGGIYTFQGMPQLENNLFLDNSAVNDGGALGFRDPSGTVFIRHSTFHGNTAGVGGAVCIDNDNYTTTRVRFRRSILWGNSPDEVHVLAGNPDFEYCNIQGGFTGTGNINQDPLFVTGPGGDFYLSSIAAGQATDSPCIDSGNILAEDACFLHATGIICMNELTVQTDQAVDTGDADMGYHYKLRSVVEAAMSCVPSSGTLPFNSTLAVSLNHDRGVTRRLAAQIHVSLANGLYISSWQAGFTNIAAGENFHTSWSQNFPLIGSLAGDNVFNLVAMDVSPPPYNNPPRPLAGETDTDICTVTGATP